MVLVDENCAVHEHVRKVVLNSITRNGFSIVLKSPTKNAENISLNAPYALTALAVVAVVGGLGIAYLRSSWF